MSRVGFEPTNPVLEWAKTVHTLDREAIVIGGCELTTFYFQHKMENKFALQETLLYTHKTIPPF
jgi:hypothetical protein